MSEYNDTCGNITCSETGIFKGILSYNATELDGLGFISIFDDGMNWTMKRDCSVNNLNNFCIEYMS